MSTLEQLSESDTSRIIAIASGELELDIHYNEIGHGDNVVIFLHGSGPGATSWANFSRNIEAFANAGYRVLLMDSPGWGKSSPIICDGSRSDLNATALKGFMDALGLSKASLVGNSMGGHTAVAFTLTYPQMTEKLILMGGGTGGPSQFVPMPTEGIKLLQGLYREPTLENLKKMMNVFVYDTSHLTDALFELRLQNMLSNQTHLENFVKSLELNPKQFPDFGNRLAEIRCETLVIWGRDDRFVPMDVGLKLIRGIENAELHIFNKCGHWAQWEHADKFNKLALDFLAY